MNFRICISLFLLCCLLQPSTAQQPVTKPKEVTVKAMTYNTYSGRKQGIDKIAEVIMEFVNHILYADSEKTIRQIVADFADKYDLDRYFVYGYGSHHLWLKQRKITNPDITFEYRILIVEY